MNLLVTLAAIAIAAVKIGARLARMELKLNMMWQWFMREHKIQDGDNNAD